MKLRKHGWKVMTSVLLLAVAATSALADVTNATLDKDLIQLGFPVEGMTQRTDSERQDFLRMGVLKAPSNLTSAQHDMLLRYARILWNRDYEDHIMLRAIHQANQPSQKSTLEKKELAQKRRLMTALDLYNHRVQDIQNSRTLAHQERDAQALSVSVSQSSCRVSQAKVQSNDSLSRIARLSIDSGRVFQVFRQQTEAAEDVANPPEELEVQPPVLKLFPLQSKPLVGLNPTVTASPTETVATVDLKRVSSVDIKNSQFVLTGTSPAPGKAVVVVVHGPSGSLRNYSTTADSNGKFSLHTYLIGGAGNYQAEVFYHRPQDAPSANGGMIKVLYVKNDDSHDERYRFPSVEVQSDAPQIVAQAHEIVAAANAVTDFQKAKAISDWMAKNISYDNATYQKILNDQSTAYFDSLSVLKARHGICTGYSMLFAALARAAGLQAKVVEGTVRWTRLHHDWNEVKIDGKWVQIEPQNGLGLDPGTAKDFAKNFQETQTWAD